MRNSARFSATFLVTVAALFGGRAFAASAGHAPWPTHGWLHSSAEAQGLDSDSLADAFDYVRDHDTRIHSLTIVRNGHIVLDAYFWPFHNGQLHDVASVTKSVTTTLAGIAAGQGAFAGLSQPLTSIFSGRAIAKLDDRKKRLSLIHLMSMSSGLDCQAAHGEITLGQMRQSKDWTQFMLDRSMIDEPGSRFEYCSGGMHLLSAAITKATGFSALDFARRELFSPLGISNVTWPADSQGVSYGWGDLRLEPRDMAKLGYLWLNNGRWEDRQIIPKGWMQAAIQAQARPPYMDQKYGYGFWLHTSRRPSEFEAVGRGGQRITVVPEKNIVVVFTGGQFEPGEIGAFIGRALKADQPLPENPSGTARLAAAVREAAMPRLAASYVPPLAKSVSGRRYILAANPLNLKSFVLTLSDAPGPQLELEVGDLRDGPRPIGLNGVPRLSSGGPSGLPVAVMGTWERENIFFIEYNEVGGINTYRLRLRFTGDDVDVTLSERSQVIPSARFRGTSAR
ncbi:serine hydrolase [Paucibacter sp. PLA-PC-4]|uniref:serine hydrolase domain-containing protein n=1 Tax=Paucibacter sp. PLA-PC-4 TaxID=2993655 RepID=UPI00224B7B38|nr:serine hydrolase [Paucibacter sp. PLA-PC-4]MCX2863725.1 serine hydrolase [Paucibacter sp. PLA-PC-4]